MTIVRRPQRALFKVTGSDAARLLHDTITAHVAAEEGPAHWFALLTPQGKIISEGLIGWAEGAFWLDVDKQSASQFEKLMRLYRMRADMVVEDLSEHFAVGWSALQADQGIVHEDPRGEGMGYRVISEQAATGDWSGDTALFAQARISSGIVEVGTDFPGGSVFPHDVGMDLNDGVDFVKGCFIGQEVVSRMRHKTEVRRRPLILSGVEGAPGDKAMLGERSVGEIGAVAGGKAIGILRIDRLAPDSRLSLNGKPVSLAVPAWASYRFGDSAGV